MYITEILFVLLTVAIFFQSYVINRLNQNNLICFAAYNYTVCFAEIDKLIAVRELFIWERNILDFWFLVKNIDDFLNIDKSKCSHWFEWDDARFFWEEELENISVLPKDIFEIIRKSKENVLVELV